jgi:23S rRNA pseudouridine1911/1915/1917 synthase
MITIYEDNEILVLDKPSGVVVNRSNTYAGQTVQDFVEDQIDFTESDEDSEFKSRSGVVHRLDKDTSGILLVAKTPDSFVNIQKQFKDRTVKKTYNAISLGKSQTGRFEINAPLNRNPKDRLSMAVVVGGKEARTEFDFVKHIKIDETTYSYIKAFPYTGRTHQIRVHLAALNLPVAADPIYCTRAQYDLSTQAFNRMMLHALNIEFTHPTTGERVTFEAPLPEEFKKHI